MKIKCLNQRIYGGGALQHPQPSSTKYTFFAQLEERWQKPGVKRLVTWPINMRIGRI